MLVKGSMGMQNFQSRRIGQFCFDYVIDKKIPSKIGTRMLTSASSLPFHPGVLSRAGDLFQTPIRLNHEGFYFRWESQTSEAQWDLQS